MYLSQEAASRKIKGRMIKTQRAPALGNITQKLPLKGFQ